MLNPLDALRPLPDPDPQAVRAWLRDGPAASQVLRWLESADHVTEPELIGDLQPESLNVEVVWRIARNPAHGARLASLPSLNAELARALEAALHGHIARCFERRDPEQPSDEPPHPDAMDAAAGLTQLYYGGLAPSGRIRRSLFEILGQAQYEFTSYGTLDVIDHPAREAAFRALNAVQDLGERELGALAAASSQNEDRMAALVTSPSADEGLWEYIARSNYSRAVQERLVQQPGAREVDRVRNILKGSSYPSVLEAMIQLTRGEERREVVQKLIDRGPSEALELLEKNRWDVRECVEAEDIQPLLEVRSKEERLRAIQLLSVLKAEAAEPAADAETPDEPRPTRSPTAR